MFILTNGYQTLVKWRIFWPDEDMTSFPVLPRTCNKILFGTFLGLKGQPIYFSNTKISGIPKYVDSEKHPLTVRYIYVG